MICCCCCWRWGRSGRLLFFRFLANWVVVCSAVQPATDEICTNCTCSPVDGGGGGGDDANDCSHTPASKEEEEEVYLTAQVATSLIRISPIKQVNSILLSGWSRAEIVRSERRRIAVICVTFQSLVSLPVSVSAWLDTCSLKPFSVSGEMFAIIAQSVLLNFESIVHTQLGTGRCNFLPIYYSEIYPREPEKRRGSAIRVWIVLLGPSL